jgi:hypothetical protein
MRIVLDFVINGGTLSFSFGKFVETTDGETTDGEFVETTDGETTDGKFVETTDGETADGKFVKTTDGETTDGEFVETTDGETTDGEVVGMLKFLTAELTFDVERIGSTSSLETKMFRLDVGTSIFSLIKNDVNGIVQSLLTGPYTTIKFPGLN